MFADNLRIESAVAIARCVEFHLAQLALHGLLRAAVATITGSLRLFGGGRFRITFTAQMHIHLRVEHPLESGLHHRPHQLIEFADRCRRTSKLLC